MSARNLGRMALAMNDSEENQFVVNTIVSRQIFHDPADAQMLMGQHRVGMLKNKYNRLAKKYTFAFITGDEILSTTSLFEVD